MRKTCALALVHLPPLLWAALVGFLLTVPGRPRPLGGLPLAIEEALGWAAHFVFFFALAWLIERSVRSWPGVRALPGLGFSVAVAAGYGILLETLQTWTPGRSASLLDAAADVAGAATLLLLRRREG